MKPGLIALDAVRNGTDLYAGTSLSPIYPPIKQLHLRRDTGATKRDGNTPTGRSLVIRRASEITPEPIEWLWPGRVAIGKQTMIVGEPGLGKSQLTAFMAAAITTAGQWPCNEGQAPLGSVIILSAEDDAADTIRPRLDAARADATRVLIVSAVRSDDGKGRRTFNLQADLDLLEQEITKARDVRLVIIDPISSYMGKTDSHRNSDVRGVLEPVGEMAARLRVAVVSVTHKSKGKGNSAINSAIGSVGFTGVARTAFLVDKDPDDPDRRLFLQIKNNIAKDAGGLAFRIGQHMLPGGIIASAIFWHSERVSCTADEILAANENASEQPARTEAADFLRDVLKNEPRPAKDVEGEAKEAGISWRTVNRAKKKLGVVAERRAESGDGLGRTGRWYWSLPADTNSPSKDAKNSYECHDLNVATLGKFGTLRSKGGGL
jgi:AAA domain-containing protein